MTETARCKHELWIGSPPGYTATDWRCQTCGAHMTAGEMILWGKLFEITKLLNSTSAAERKE